jgi:uncharacterized protein YecT (DUF1311 family)
MAEDKQLKSSYELAMERLQKKDADAGVESKPLTDAQKAAIAEARNLCQAKLAEREVLHQSALMRTIDRGERDALDLEYRSECERLKAERDAKIAKVRNEPR